MVLSNSISYISAIPYTFTDSFKGVIAVCAYICAVVYLHLISVYRNIIVSKFIVIMFHLKICPFTKICHIHREERGKRKEKGNLTEIKHIKRVCYTELLSSYIKVVDL